MMNSEQNHNSRSTCSLLGDDCDSPKSNLRASCLTIFFLRLLYLKHFFPSDIIKDILGVLVNFCCNNKQPLHLHSLQQQTHIFPLWLCVLTGGHTLQISLVYAPLRNLGWRVWMPRACSSCAEDGAQKRNQITQVHLKPLLHAPLITSLHIPKRASRPGHPHQIGKGTPPTPAGRLSICRK